MRWKYWDESTRGVGWCGFWNKKWKNPHIESEKPKQYENQHPAFKQSWVPASQGTKRTHPNGWVLHHGAASQIRTGHPISAGPARRKPYDLTIYITDEVARFLPARTRKKNSHPNGWEFFLELLARFELATSSLPRMRSTDWAIAAYSVLCVTHTARLL